jgi:tRNA threonylcarbamoyladenosine modification (KEOPS) complex  Pcc1 subunit
MPEGELTAVLTRNCENEAMASTLKGAISPDNGLFADVTQEKGKLTIQVRARNVAELRRTLDDLLACLSAAEKTWDKATGAHA